MCEPIVFGIPSNFTAAGAQLHPMLIQLTKQLSPYLKSDGTYYLTKHSSFSDFSSCLKYLHRLTEVVSNSNFNKMLIEAGFAQSEADNIVRSSQTMLTNLSKAASVDDLISAIVLLMLRFNSHQFGSNKLGACDGFIKCFTNTEATESIRSPGVRSYWRTKKLLCTSADALSNTSILTYLIFIDYTSCVVEDEEVKLLAPTPRCTVIDYPSGNAHALLISLLNGVGLGDVTSAEQVVASPSVAQGVSRRGVRQPSTSSAVQSRSYSSSGNPQ